MAEDVVGVTDRRYVLALLRIEDGGAIKSTVPGSTWIQKMMYVASRAHPEIECYNFESNKFGMHSSRLKNILDGLRKDGLINVNETADSNRSPISLTRNGRRLADTDSVTNNPNVIRTLRVVKSTLNKLTYNELIVLMYTKFPEMLDKSEQKVEYEDWKEQSALSMVRDDKISFSLGVQISGLDRTEFEKRLEDASLNMANETEEKRTMEISM